MAAPDRPSPSARGCGVLLLGVSGLLVAGIVHTGIVSGLKADPGDFAHVVCVGLTIILGPLALFWLVCGVYLLRRGWK